LYGCSNDLIVDLVFGQSLQLVEHIGEQRYVPAFQSYHQFSLEGIFYQQVIDRRLRSGSLVAALLAYRHDEDVFPGVLL